MISKKLKKNAKVYLYFKVFLKQERLLKHYQIIKKQKKILKFILKPKIISKMNLRK